MKRSRMKNTTEAACEDSEVDSDIEDEYSDVLYDDGDLDESRQDDSSTGEIDDDGSDESDSDSLECTDKHIEFSSDDSFDADLYL